MVVKLIKIYLILQAVLGVQIHYEKGNFSD